MLPENSALVSSRDEVREHQRLARCGGSACAGSVSDDDSSRMESEGG